MKWNDILPLEARCLCKQLSAKAQAERACGRTIYPKQSELFRALEMTPPNKVRVVIVGQDPYHGPGQANGLAFSVNPDVPPPPSLKNIFKELKDDIGVETPATGDLSPWAKQGVLLLNTVLTVENGKANSHKLWGWQDFTLAVFQACVSLPQPVVFILWGGQARAFTAGLQLSNRANKACVFSSHPSPLSASTGGYGVPAFLGSKPFSQTNALLKSMGAEPIDWAL